MLYQGSKWGLGLILAIAFAWWFLQPLGRPAFEVAAPETQPEVIPEKTTGDHWPAFRGPKGNGVSESKQPPTHWSAKQGLLWATSLPGPGSSSPIVYGEKVFVTCYSGYGDGSEGKVDNLQRHLICFDRRSGNILWNITVKSLFEEDPYRGFITEHGYASSTPVTDGNSVFAFFGKSGVHAFDMAGKPLWKTSVGTRSGNRRWGSAASPILFGEVVIINASEESRSIQALDKKTGKLVWKAEGDVLELSYGTPVIQEIPGKKPELVLSVPGEIWGVNPLTGGLKWFAKTKLPGNVSPSLCLAEGLAISFGGYPSSAVAVKTGGSGDVTSTNIVWTGSKSSYIPSGVVKGKHLYWVNDRGLATCAEAATGNILFQERIGLGSGEGAFPVYGSTVLAGENLYTVTRRNGVLVWKASETYTKVSFNTIEGDETDFNPSLAISENNLFIRSNKAIYCIGGK